MSLVILQSWGGNLGVDYQSTMAMVFFGLFSLLMLGIGFVASRYMSSEEDYYVAGRSAGILVIALSIFASTQSGWGIIGLSGTVYALGTEFMMWATTVIVFSFVISYWLVGRKMRVLGTTINAITVPDAMYHRFEDERVRLLGAISVFLGSMGYLAAQYAALGIIMAVIFPVNFITGLIIGLGIVGVYTVIGGILAAIWSDAIQGAIMALSGILTFYFIVTSNPGGVGQMITTVQGEFPQFFNFTLLGMDGLAPLGLLLSILIINLTHAGQPHAITKFYMIRRVSLLKWGALISGAAYLMTTLFWWAAPYMRAAVARGDVRSFENPDLVLPLALIEFAPDIVTAFVLTGIVAAIMSTSNGFLNVGASAITHDFMKEYRQTEMTNEQEVRYGRIATATILVIAGVIAATFPGLIFVLGAAGWAIFATVIFPGVALAYNWKGATTEGILWGGSVGLLSTLVFAYGGQYFGWSAPFSLLGGQFAQLIGIVVFVGVSLITSTATYEDLKPEVKAALDTGRLKGGQLPEHLVADGGEDEIDA
ncbi:sodium/proline symporter [Halogranum amylolyticum]|uniref:Sodium/proline symporter n=1 Tax=Halogranum amylolyticum TaxID=660520 RepID=A0A1H8VWR9_9EURY|nr:Na+:solute symporter [Halogranum amylolyticum]SEP19831.1 sodium/proline symporter [Halogranum amylolyticum]